MPCPLSILPPSPLMASTTLALGSVCFPARAPFAVVPAPWMACLAPPLMPPTAVLTWWLSSPWSLAPNQRVTLSGTCVMSRKLRERWPRRSPPTREILRGIRVPLRPRKRLYGLLAASDFADLPGNRVEFGFFLRR